MAYHIQQMIMAAQKAGNLLKGFFPERASIFLWDENQVGRTPAEVCSQRVALRALLPHEKIPTNRFGHIGPIKLTSRQRIVVEDVAATYTIPNRYSTYRTLDHLDGTDTYLYSDSPADYGVMIGRVFQGQSREGVIYLPARDLLFCADSAGAARFHRESHTMLYFKHRSDRTLRETFVGVSLNANNDPQLYRRGYQKLRKKVAGVLSYASNAAGFAALFEGQIGAYICISGKKANVWEFVAGDAITRQAGGVSSDYKGKPLRWNNIRVVGVWSTNKTLHRQIIEAIRD
jgi:fructose-1,6-bisphosphatase/inositol monophosphatase family enzyme